MKRNNKYIFFVLGIFFLSIETKALKLEGNFIQGGIIFGTLDEQAIVYLDDQSIPVDIDGNFLFGFSRKHKDKSILKIIYKTGKVTYKNLNISKRKYKIQKINNLEEKKVTPPKSYYDRIKSESIIIKKAKEEFYDFPFYKRGFIMPVNGIITGVYGSQRVLNGILKRPHYGIDIANKRGTIIVSPSDGVIVLSETDLYFSGGTIIISHGMGLTSSLLHLSEIFVNVGDKIIVGQEVGRMGSTGRSTGPHLDWRMEIRGVRVDPQLLIK